MSLFKQVISEVEENISFVWRAIQNGAFLVMKRPFTTDTIMQMHTHAMRERLHKYNRYNLNSFRCEAVRESAQTNRISVRRMENDHGTLKNLRGKTLSNKDQVCQSVRKHSYNDTKTNGTIKRKACTEWTEELHEKFIDAINHLGEGRCYPKDILEHMNVPGLTRMQVASHLQKCRNDSWRTREKNKTSHSLSSTRTVSTSSSQRGSSPRKFGSMPRLDKTQINGIQESVNLQVLESRPFTTKNMQQREEYIGPGSTHIAKFDSKNGAEEVAYNSEENYSSSYDQLFTDLGNIVPCSDSHALLSNQRQPSDDFFDFLREMECYNNAFNATALPDQEPVTNPGLQQILYDHDGLFPDQHSGVANNGVIKPQ